MIGTEALCTHVDSAYAFLRLDTGEVVRVRCQQVRVILADGTLGDAPD